MNGPKAEQVSIEPFFSYTVFIEGRHLRSSFHTIVWAVWETLHEIESGQARSLITINPLCLDPSYLFD